MYKKGIPQGRPQVDQCQLNPCYQCVFLFVIRITLKANSNSNINGLMLG